MNNLKKANDAKLRLIKHKLVMALLTEPNIDKSLNSDSTSIDEVVKKVCDLIQYLRDKDTLLNASGHKSIVGRYSLVKSEEKPNSSTVGQQLHHSSIKYMSPVKPLIVAENAESRNQLMP
jgi:hypothetical protein